ncbi:hypothetical protein B484DRAFT_405036 [Ochromonadaceae sp. CCMP2298]|nr:hypothetical protein B484DRAFT_405036 [Ochromonadaceae sp. CCMP2298]
MLKHVIFSILLPLFLRSEEFERYQDRRNETSVRSNAATQWMREDSERLSKIEGLMLASSNWTARARAAINNHFIALCIIDTQVEGAVVYVNKAFAELTGKSLYAGLRVLGGKDTDLELQAELLAAAFLDLVALRPLVCSTGGSRKHMTGKFVLATFLPATRTGRPEDLACVDELLTIFSYLLVSGRKSQS